MYVFTPGTLRTPGPKEKVEVYGKGRICRLLTKAISITPAPAVGISIWVDRKDYSSVFSPFFFNLYSFHHIKGALLYLTPPGYSHPENAVADWTQFCQLQKMDLIVATGWGKTMELFCQILKQLNSVSNHQWTKCSQVTFVNRSIENQTISNIPLHYFDVLHERNCF